MSATQQPRPLLECLSVKQGEIKSKKRVSGVNERINLTAT